MSIKDRLKSVPPLYWMARWSRMAVGELTPPKQLAGVPGRIHANDTMIPKRIDEHAPGYVSDGRQISALLDEHLPEEMRRSGGEGLDLGCGHGRILRHLVADFPSIRWTAADVDRSAVRFCRREFGVEAVLSSRQLGEVELPHVPYDIVWMGSLITHLGDAGEPELWRLLHRIMAPGALLVLSTMGPTCVERLDIMMPNGSEQAPRITAELASRQRAYVSYPHYRRVEYGLTFHTADYIDAAVREGVSPDAVHLVYEPDGWAAFQDLHVFRLGHIAER